MSESKERSIKWGKRLKIQELRENIDREMKMVGNLKKKAWLKRDLNSHSSDSKCY